MCSDVMQTGSRIAHCAFSIASPSVIVATVPEKSRRCISFSVSRSRTSAIVGTIPSQHSDIPKSPEYFRWITHLWSRLHHIFPWLYHVPALLVLLAETIPQSIHAQYSMKAVGKLFPSSPNSPWQSPIYEQVRLLSIV